MRRTLLAAVVFAATLAPDAGAKAISRIEVCGADGCRASAVPKGLHEWPGGGPATAPPAPAPFVELRITIDRTHTERLWYVPKARLFASERGRSVWWSPVSTQRIDRIIARAARRIEPYRPRVVAASVDGVRVAGDVSGYLDLFRVGTTTADVGSRGFVEVSLKTKPASPWAVTALWFYPAEGVLQRGGEHVRLPAGIAADLRAARPLGGAQSSSGFAWPLVSGWLLVAAALALAAAILLRRSRRAGS